MIPAFLQFIPESLRPLAEAHGAALDEIFDREKRGQSSPLLWGLPVGLAPWAMVFWIKISWAQDDGVLIEGFTRYRGAIMGPLLVLLRESWWIPDGAGKFLVDIAKNIKTGKLPGQTAFYPEMPELAIQMVGNHNKQMQRYGVQLLNLLGSSARKAVEVAATSHSSITARREFSKIAVENGWTVASQKLVAGDAEKLELVRRLVLAWGQNRHPDFTHWIKIVTQTLPSPPTFDKVSEREGWWQTTAKSADPGLLGQLLQFAWPKQWKDARARIQQLNRFPPDPRIAEAVLQVQEQNPYDSWGSNPFHSAANQLIVKHASVHCSQTAASVAASQAERWHRESIFPKNWLESYHDRSRYQPLSPGEQAIVEQARAMVGSEDRTELLNALYQQVYAFPDQDEPRLVLADLLTELGDPRGEFIQLQCGAQTPASQRKARALLKQHGTRWEAQLPGAIIDTVVFERGFPVFAKVHPHSLDIQFQSPHWATVQVIEAPWRGELDKLGTLLALPGAASLHTLINFNGSRTPFAVPPEHARRIKKLVVNGLAPGWLTQFPNLESLHADVQSLHTAGPCPSVKEIYIYVYDDNPPSHDQILTLYPQVRHVCLFASGNSSFISAWKADIMVENGKVTEIILSWSGDNSWHRTDFIGALARSWARPGVPITVAPGKLEQSIQNRFRTQLQWVRPEDLKWLASESTSA